MQRHYCYVTHANANINKKHLKNVGPIRHCEPPHANSPDVASGTVVRRLRINVHDDDNAWQRGPLWPLRMGPMIRIKSHSFCCKPFCGGTASYCKHLQDLKHSFILFTCEDPFKRFILVLSVCVCLQHCIYAAAVFICTNWHRDVILW